MDRNEIEQRVKKIVVDFSGSRTLTESDLNSDTRLKGDIGLDSLDLIELEMQVETDFCITIDTKAYGEIKTVGDMVSYIEKATPLQ